jgi:hypothetical protein
VWHIPRIPFQRPSLLRQLVETQEESLQMLRDIRALLLGQPLSTGPARSSSSRANTPRLKLSARDIVVLTRSVVQQEALRQANLPPSDPPQSTSDLPLSEGRTVTGGFSSIPAKPKPSRP